MDSLRDLVVVSYTARLGVPADQPDFADCCLGLLGRPSPSVRTVDAGCWPTIHPPPDSRCADAWPVIGDHWRSLAAVQSVATAPRSDVHVLAGAIRDSDVRDAEWARFRPLLGCTPGTPDGDWWFLGYDAIDVTFRSVLYGCGEFSLSEDCARDPRVAAARARLNLFGLFMTIDDAEAASRLAGELSTGGASAAIPCAVFEVLAAGGRSGPAILDRE